MRRPRTGSRAATPAMRPLPTGSRTGGRAPTPQSGRCRTTRGTCLHGRPLGADAGHRRGRVATGVGRQETLGMILGMADFRQLAAGVVRATKSLDTQAGDRPGDHQLLDLAGPFEDRVDLRVTVPALDGVFTGVAVATQNLDGLLGDAHR